MRVVCIKSDWTIGDKRICVPDRYPVKGEIYTVGFYEWDDENTYYYLKEIEGGLWNAKGFRPTDDTFGYFIADVLEKEIEFEEAVTKGEL
jgi:hypothetical protein